MSATPAEPGCAAATCLMDWFTSTNELHERVYAPYALRPVAVRLRRAGGGVAMSAYRVILRVVFWVILSVVLVAVSFWVYAIVTGGKHF